MGKEAVQKESWLTGEELADWRARGLPPAPASPHPPARAVLTAPRQQVARPTPTPVPPGWAPKGLGTSLPGREGPSLSREALLWLGA